MDVQSNIFRKGFESTDEALEFGMHVRDGNEHEIECMIAAHPEWHGEGPVDPKIFTTSEEDIDLYEETRPTVLAEDRDRDHKFVEQVAALRDENIGPRLQDHSTVMPWPSGLLEVSTLINMYLRYTSTTEFATPKYLPGKDYLCCPDEDEYKNVVIRGLAPTETQETIGVIDSVVTLRDAAAFVHKDNPFDFFVWMMRKFDQWKVPRRQMFNPHSGTKFSIGGPISTNAVVLGIAERIGPLSFRRKWELLEARPAEHTPGLPQAYAEGHPWHPKCGAMHKMIWETMGATAKLLYDTRFILPFGETVGEAVDKTVANGGDWRVSGGVHTPFDQEVNNEMIDMLVNRVVDEFMRKQAGVLCGDVE